MNISTSFPFFKFVQPPRLFGHRGASGYRPENTLPAFRLALEIGAPYLELDVRMTLDGHVVVLHDRTVERTTDGSGAVDQMILQEVKGLDAGYRFCDEGDGSYPFRGRGIQVPTLGEVLKTFPKAFLNIEVKQPDPPLEEALEEVLLRCEALDRVLLAAKRGEVMAGIRRRFRDRLATGICEDEGIRLVQWILSGRKGDISLEGQALQIPDTLNGHEYITADLLEIVHGLGLEVHVWTVNDPHRMRQLLQMGVDGIMTDYPDRFLDVMRET